MGGKSGGTKIHQYYAGFHYVLCRGPIDKIMRFTSDDKIAWEGSQSGNGTINIDAKDLYGGETSEGGVAGAMDICMGGPTQTVNSYLAGVLAGKLVPAYRTVVSTILNKFYIGQNPYAKKVGWRLQRVHIRQDGIAQWYDEKSAIGSASSVNSVLLPTADGWRYKQVASADSADYSDPHFDDSSWSVGASPFGSADNHPYLPALGYPAVVGTHWDTLSKMWIRNTFSLDKATSFTLDICVDDYATVWLNGYKILDRTGTGGSGGSLTDFIHSISIDSSHTVKGTNIIVALLEDTVSSTPRWSYGAFQITPIASDIYDMNPAHIIRECITDPDWGMGYLDADVNDDDATGNNAPFKKAADTLFGEQMGMSLEWNAAGSIDDFVQTIVDHIDAAVYVDRRTGKFNIRLIRDDYVVEDLLELNPDNVQSVTDYDQPVFGELVNSITVNFTDIANSTDGSVTEQDTALASAQGAVIDKEKDYKGFTNGVIASRVALRDLMASSGQPVSCKVQANRVAENLTLGECFKLTWPDFKMNKMVMRITGISYGDGKSNRIMITCTQDKYKLPAQGTVTPTDPGWENTVQTPTAVTRRLALEMPYVELLQAYGQTTVDQAITDAPENGFVGCSGSRPQSGARDADMYDDPGSGYRRVGTMNFCPSAVLSADIAQGSAQITFAIEDPVDMDGDVGAWCLIDDEIFPVVSASETSVTVGRGAMDTVSAKHLAGAVVFFPDDFLTSDTTQFTEASSVGVKMLTNTSAGQLPIAGATEDVVVLAGRAALPYPPGLVTVAGTAYPSTVSGTFTTTWAHRNRLTQADVLVPASAASVTPAPNTRYGLQFYDSSAALLVGRTDIGPGTASVVLNYTGDVTMKLYTIDENGASLFHHEIVFAYTKPAGTVVSAITATAYTPVDDSTIIDGGGDA